MIKGMKLESKNIQRNKFYSSFSVVIEWENVVYSEMWRTQDMLKKLCNQIIQLSPNFVEKPEIIVVYDSDDIDGKQVEEIVNTCLENCISLIQLKILPSPGSDYTGLKTFGAKNSYNEVIILLDCDVIPVAGWLLGYLEAFERQDVKVVRGVTFMHTNSITEKAFSLFWPFPPKFNTDNHICETRIFLLDNVAFRRETLESHPLPNIAQYRGQNMDLSEELWRNGIKIFQQPKSIVYHPPPNGLKHFVIRAFCQGHDIAVARKRYRNSKSLPLLNNDLRNRRSPRRIFSTIHKRSKRVTMRLKDYVPVYTTIASFYILMFIAIGISSKNPQLIRNHFSV